MSTKVIMPQLGESVVEGTVTKWLYKVGESIKELDPLLEVNTDKVDTEIPSPASGILLKITIPEGTTVQAGTVLAWIGQQDEKIPEEEPSSDTGQKDKEGKSDNLKEQKTVQKKSQAAGHSRDLGFISPVVAKLAKEYTIDLADINGSGENGRITKQDVLSYLEKQAVKSPQAKETETHQEIWETPADGDLFRPTELFTQTQYSSDQPFKKSPTPDSSGQRIPNPVKNEDASPVPSDGSLIRLTNLRKSIADHMSFSKHTSPHVTTVMEADLSRVVANREANKANFERDGIDLTFTAYFITAIAAALKTFPIVNSSWIDEGILIHRQINIGMAVALADEGLIVPVIKKADELSLLGLAKAVNNLASRARAHQLQADDVRGGTFTLTNHGVSGSLFATPIINQPQSAILGSGAIQKRVVVIDDAIAIRPMVYLTLTFDHRILDGAIADHFLSKVVKTLENWQ